MTAPAAAAGRLIENPVSGERIVIRRSGASTGGRLLVFDLYLPPGGHVPAGHVHPVQEERFTVVEGRMRFRLAGRRAVVAGPGDTVVVPPRTAHWFGNAGPGEAHARVEVRPALRMEEFFEATEAMARAGHLLGTRLPRPWDLAAVLLEYRREVAVPHVPEVVVRLAAGALAWAAHAARRRSRARAASSLLAPGSQGRRPTRGRCPSAADEPAAPGSGRVR